MMTRRGFLKRLVGLGVGVLGVHQAMKAPTTASNVVFDRSGGIEKRKGSAFICDTRGEQPYILLHPRQYEDLRREWMIEWVDARR